MADNSSALVPVFSGSINNEPAQLVDARGLHGFLSIDTDFRKWVARRIEEYGFQEDEDFRSFLGESSGGRRSREYHLTLDMAKQLAMVERNEKGRQARRYFLECEKRLHQQSTPAALASDSGKPYTLAYQDGRHFRIIVEPGRIWCLEADVMRVLGLYRQSPILKQIPAERRSRRLFGKQEYPMLDAAAVKWLANPAYAEQGKAKALQQFLEQLQESELFSSAQPSAEPVSRDRLTSARDAASQYYHECQKVLANAGVAMPQPQIDQESAALGLLTELLTQQRFVLQLDHNLQMQLAPIPQSAVFINPADAASITQLVKERVPAQLLPVVMEAGLQRLTKLTGQYLTQG